MTNITVPCPICLVNDNERCVDMRTKKPRNIKKPHKRRAQWVANKIYIKKTIDSFWNQ